MAVKYRDLIGSDILRKGDQWWCSEFLVWSDTVQVGDRVDSTLSYRYRRPIVGRPRKTTRSRPTTPCRFYTGVDGAECNRDKESCCFERA